MDTKDPSRNDAFYELAALERIRERAAVNRRASEAREDGFVHISELVDQVLNDIARRCIGSLLERVEKLEAIAGLPPIEIQREALVEPATPTHHKEG
jgi:hypothetical protein